MGIAGLLNLSHGGWEAMTTGAFTEQDLPLAEGFTAASTATRWNSAPKPPSPSPPRPTPCSPASPASASCSPPASPASFFCKPYRSWEKGGVENFKGLVRQYIPKGMDFGAITVERLHEVQEELNNRPRNILG